MKTCLPLPWEDTYMDKTSHGSGRDSSTEAQSDRVITQHGARTASIPRVLLVAALHQNQTVL